MQHLPGQNWPVVLLVQQIQMGMSGTSALPEVIKMKGISNKWRGASLNSMWKNMRISVDITPANFPFGDRISINNKTYFCNQLCKPMNKAFVVLPLSLHVPQWVIMGRRKKHVTWMTILDGSYLSLMSMLERGDMLDNVMIIACINRQVACKNLILHD